MDTPSMPGVITAEEMLKDLEEYQRHMEKIGYIDQGYICLDTGSGSTYDIGIGMASNKAEILRWVMHLLEKRWVTKEHIIRFANLAAQESGLSLFGP